MNKEIICPNCSQRIKILDTFGYDLYLENLKKEEIEILNTNLEVVNEDLTRIAQLLNLEEGCTIYDIEDKIKRLNNIINELEKYLEEIKDRVIMYGIDDDTYKTTNLYRDIKNKIKELQGSDKE